MADIRSYVGDEGTSQSAISAPGVCALQGLRKSFFDFLKQRHPFLDKMTQKYRNFVKDLFEKMLYTL